MATYPKTLKTLEIHLMLDSEVVSIADTAEDNKATRALNEFEMYDTMHLEDGQMIPYHAVQYIKATKTVAQVEKAEAYDCEKSCCE